jgi:hypothetical protein
MLSAKIGYVPIISIENKRETKKERDHRIIQKTIKHKALRAIKKICKIVLKVVINLYSSKIVVYLNIQNNHSENTMTLTKMTYSILLLPKMFTPDSIKEVTSYTGVKRTVY